MRNAPRKPATLHAATQTTIPEFILYEKYLSPRCKMLSTVYTRPNGRSPTAPHSQSHTMSATLDLLSTNNKVAQCTHGKEPTWNYTSRLNTTRFEPAYRRSPQVPRWYGPEIMCRLGNSIHHAPSGWRPLAMGNAIARCMQHWHAYAYSMQPGREWPPSCTCRHSLSRPCRLRNSCVSSWEACQWPCASNSED